MYTYTKKKILADLVKQQCFNFQNKKHLHVSNEVLCQKLMCLKYLKEITKLKIVSTHSK